jgi:hypothetical protein
MDNVTANRTLFLTKSGGTGIGPYDAQDGDLATVLLGSRRCIILRPQGLWYRVVGDAYVHGAMNGEFVKDGVAGARVFPLC